MVWQVALGLVGALLVSAMTWQDSPEHRQMLADLKEALQRLRPVAQRAGVVLPDVEELLRELRLIRAARREKGNQP